MEILDKIKNYDLFIQIGTNTGKDNFNKLVYKYKPKKVILVEPNSQLISKIKENYKENSKFCEIIIINKVIYSSNEFREHIDVKNMSKGTYFIQIDMGDEQVTNKIVLK